METLRLGTFFWLQAESMGLATDEAEVGKVGIGAHLKSHVSQERHRFALNGSVI